MARLDVVPLAHTPRTPLSPTLLRSLDSSLTFDGDEEQRTPVRTPEEATFLPGSPDQEQTVTIEDEAQRAPHRPMLEAVFHAGMSGEEAEAVLEEYGSPNVPTPRAASPGGNNSTSSCRFRSRYDSLRCSVLEIGRAPSNPIAHPPVGDVGDRLSSAVQPLTGKFTMRGELMHVRYSLYHTHTVSHSLSFCLLLSLALSRSLAHTHTYTLQVFLSYRVATEGPAGTAGGPAGGPNGLSGSIADRVRMLSMDGRQELQIPRHGWGSWPQGIKKPSPFRPEEAKVFLDKACLQVIASTSLTPTSLAAPNLTGV